MKTKVCGNCRAEKSVDDFYKKSSSKDGIDWRCKDCDKQRTGSGNTKAWRSKNKDKLRAYERTAHQKNPMIGRKKVSAYYHSHPAQVGAKNAIQTAIKQGVLPERSVFKCANPDCTKQAEQYHHWSYEKQHWLSVVPLCKTCHLSLHGGAWQMSNPQAFTVKAVR